MKRIVIKCPKCSGPMWEEELPDTDRIMDLVCIVCGLRKFYPKQRYLKWRRRMEKDVKAVATTRRVLPA